MGEGEVDGVDREQAGRQALMRGSWEQVVVLGDMSS